MTIYPEVSEEVNPIFFFLIKIYYLKIINCDYKNRIFININNLTNRQHPGDCYNQYLNHHLQRKLTFYKNCCTTTVRWGSEHTDGEKIYYNSSLSLTGQYTIFLL